jgi:hypothetical protein
MLRTALALSCLALLIGCPPANDDDSADDDDAATISPTEGTWDLTLTELVTDSCDGAPGAQPGDSLGTTEVALSTAAGVDFTMTDSDNQVFECTLGAGGAFSCVGVPKNIPLPVFPNATVTRDGVRAGTFSAEGVAALSNTNTDTCEGADCPVVEQAGGYTFPCVFEFDADAEAQ